MFKLIESETINGDKIYYLDYISKLPPGNRKMFDINILNKLIEISKKNNISIVMVTQEVNAEKFEQRFRKNLK